MPKLFPWITSMSIHKGRVRSLLQTSSNLIRMWLGSLRNMSNSLSCRMALVIFTRMKHSELCLNSLSSTLSMASSFSFLKMTSSSMRKTSLIWPVLTRISWWCLLFPNKVYSNTIKLKSSSIMVGTMACLKASRIESQCWSYLPTVWTNCRTVKWSKGTSMDNA